MKILPKKSLGQNFLVDEKILNKIVELGKISKNDIVLEVGPGTGKLTEKILKKNPKHLIVVEKDKKLAEFLQNKFDHKIKIINDDILNISQNNLAQSKIIIFGNLPYNVSTQILVNWIRLDNLKNFSKKFILMFQKEVADRIIANENSKDYGRLSILSNWKMNIKKIIDINPSSFNPSPKVKSSLLILEPKSKYFNLNSAKNLEHVTKVFFNQKRKMIKKPMKILFKNFEEIAINISLNLNLRPQNLTRLNYYKICSIYEKSIQ
tara:strand:- start:4665 stop:5456 length:792 start_codon:yes stop_codon:yes gene_type:complete